MVWRYWKVSCDIDPGKLAPSQPNNHQDTELNNAVGWNYQQIHSRSLRRMIALERAAVLGVRRLRHRESQHEKVALNALGAPKRVLNAHLLDHGA